jgi:hypothetical protein
MRILPGKIGDREAGIGIKPLLVDQLSECQSSYYHETRMFLQTLASIRISFHKHVRFTFGEPFRVHPTKKSKLFTDEYRP